MNEHSFVAILMGSDSDLPSLEGMFEILRHLKIKHEVNILSAHRTPEETVVYVKQAEQRGCKIFIAAAGLAAHLAGSVAAHTLKPVIGIPLVSGEAGFSGLDALLSTVQMPPGIPVACVSVGKVGAKNAAFLAAQILAIDDLSLHEQLIQLRAEKKSELLKKNEALKIS